MAQGPATSTRILGKHLDTVTITTVTGTHTLTPFVQSVEFNHTKDLQNTTVLIDTEVAQRAARYNSSLRITCAVDSDSTFTAALLDLDAHAGDQVEYELISYSGGLTHTADGTGSPAKTAILAGLNQSITDGGQTVTIELVPDGTGGMS